MGRVTVLVVDVVRVPAVLNGLVPAAVTMLVRVVGVLAVCWLGALVPVAVVGDMRVAIVAVVEVAGMTDGGVTAALAVLVVMAGVDRVVTDGHSLLLGVRRRRGALRCGVGRYRGALEGMATLRAGRRPQRIPRRGTALPRNRPLTSASRTIVILVNILARPTGIDARRRFLLLLRSRRTRLRQRRCSARSTIARRQPPARLAPGRPPAQLLLAPGLHPLVIPSPVVPTQRQLTTPILRARRRR
jgi:hypothetical protein